MELPVIEIGCGTSVAGSLDRGRMKLNEGYETAYYSTAGQPADLGSGMIHMIPGNWVTNAKDMDTLFSSSPPNK